MSDATEILEGAISDVGYWCWWVGGLPDGFQVEFGGVQLWSEPQRPGGPPSNLLALQFGGVKYVAFLNYSDENEDLPADWPDKLAQSQIEPFTLDDEYFTISSVEGVRQILAKAASVYVLHGDPDAVDTLESSQGFLAFCAGPVGLVVLAEAMRPVTFEGPITPDDVIQRNQKWWDYWKEYWARKDSDNPMPEDYACEVTIPLQQFDNVPNEYFTK